MEKVGKKDIKGATSSSAIIINTSIKWTVFESQLTQDTHTLFFF